MGIKNTKEEFSIFSDASSDTDMIGYIEEYKSDDDFYSFDTVFIDTKVKPKKRNSCSCLIR